MTIDTNAIRETIVKDLKLDGFTPEEQQEIIDMLQENIIIKVNNDIYQLLEPKDRETYLVLGEQYQQENFGKFLQEKIPNIQELVTGVARYIVEDFKSRTV
jgi:hypothetical protein